MWLVKKAACKVVKLSQKVLKEDSEAEKMIKDIISCKQEVLPIKKMAQLATLTFDMQNFQKAVAFIKEKLNDIKMERKSLKKRLNLLTLVSYLLKHGPSGFIDEVRSMAQVFTKYEILAVTDNQEDQELYSLLLDLSQRANYIKTLLGDKSALAREKQLARKIKQKIMSQGGDYSRQNKDSLGEEGQSDKGEKVQSFLEHYVWRYTSKLDKKIDQITDALITKIDEYLDGQIPESFQIDQLETDSTKQQTHSEIDLKQRLIQVEKDFIQSKVPLQQNPQIVNLIDLDPIQGEPVDGEVHEKGPIPEKQPKQKVEKHVQLLHMGGEQVQPERASSFSKVALDKLTKEEVNGSERGQQAKVCPL